MQLGLLSSEFILKLGDYMPPIRNETTELFLSPKTIGDIELTESVVQALFIHHWERIIGPWYSISSEEKPQPIRLVSEDELSNKNTLFWKTLINERLKSEIGLSETDAEKNRLLSFLLKPVIDMPFALGKALLTSHLLK